MNRVSPGATPPLKNVKFLISGVILLKFETRRAVAAPNPKKTVIEENLEPMKRGTSPSPLP